jgi:hypothetical protein
MSVDRRADILKRLIRYEEPPEPLATELREFPWDWLEDEPLVRLRASDLLHVINRFLDGDIDAKQLQDWAERLECREDIGFGPGDEQLVNDVLFRLATPVINAPLTRESVLRMREQLYASRS